MYIAFCFDFENVIRKCPPWKGLIDTERGTSPAGMCWWWQLIGSGCAVCHYITTKIQHLLQNYLCCISLAVVTKCMKAVSGWYSSHVSSCPSIPRCSYKVGHHAKKQAFYLNKCSCWRCNPAKFAAIFLFRKLCRLVGARKRNWNILRENPQ
jgi:hypothetical protein